MPDPVDSDVFPRPIARLCARVGASYAVDGGIPRLARTQDRWELFSSRGCSATSGFGRSHNRPTAGSRRGPDRLTSATLGGGACERRPARTEMRSLGVALLMLGVLFDIRALGHQ